MTDTYCMVLTTCGSEDAAEKLARSIVEHKLGACAQISGIVSHYTWQGTLERDEEFRIVIKTRTELYRRLEQFIVDNHDYDVPQVVMVPITGGLGGYLGWIDEQTAGADAE